MFERISKWLRGEGPPPSSADLEAEKSKIKEALAEAKARAASARSDYLEGERRKLLEDGDLDTRKLRESWRMFATP